MEFTKLEVPKQNTGVLLGKRSTDFIAGTIPYEIRVESGDWRPFLPTEEKQFSKNADTMACVSFSALNGCEAQHKQQTGKEINFSDRFLAKMSDTQKFGNYQYKVADTIRNYGLVPEADYPAPENFTWDFYYAPIPEQIKQLAVKYETAYEWVGITKTDLEYHLKHAPLQIVVTKGNPDHAVLLVAIEGDKAFYFDTYPAGQNSSFIRSVPISQIYNALKIVINYQKEMKFPAIKKTGDSIIYAQCGNTLFPFASGEAYTHAGGIFGQEKELSEAEFYKFDIQAESIINNK